MAECTDLPVPCLQNSLHLRLQIEQFEVKRKLSVNLELDNYGTWSTNRSKKLQNSNYLLPVAIKLMNIRVWIDKVIKVCKSSGINAAMIVNTRSFAFTTKKYTQIWLCCSCPSCTYILCTLDIDKSVHAILILFSQKHVLMRHLLNFKFILSKPFRIKHHLTEYFEIEWKMNSRLHIF